MESYIDRAYTEPVITAQEHSNVITLFKELLAPKDLRLVKEHLTEINEALSAIKSLQKISNTDDAEPDPHILLIKFLLLTDNENQQMQTSVAKISRHHYPSNIKNSENPTKKIDKYNTQVQELFTLFNKIKMSDLESRIEGIQLLSEKKQNQLLTLIGAITKPDISLITEHLQRHQLLSVISELRAPRSLEQTKRNLAKSNRVITMLEARINGSAVSDIHDDSYALMQKFTTCSEKEKQQLLDAFMKICCVKNTSDPDGERVIKEQIATFNEFKKSAIAIKNPSALPLQKLTEYKCQQLQEAISSLCDIKNRHSIKDTMGKCYKSLKKVKTRDELNSIKNQYLSVNTTIALINELINYALSQDVVIEKKLNRKISKLTSSLNELTSLYEEKFKAFRNETDQHSKKVSQPIFKNSDESESPESIFISSLLDTSKKSRTYKKVKSEVHEIAEDGLLKLRINTICTLLDSDLFLYLFENQITSLDENEIQDYLDKVNAKKIKAIKTESELTEKVTDFFLWRSSKKALVDLCATRPLLETIITLFSLIKANEKSQDETKLKLSDYPALMQNATRIINLMPTNNRHLANIDDLLDLEAIFKRRYKTLELEKPIRDNERSIKSRQVSANEIPSIQNHIAQNSPSEIIEEPSTASGSTAKIMSKVPLSAPSITSSNESFQPDSETISIEATDTPRHQRGHVRRTVYRDLRGISVSILPTFFATALSNRSNDAANSSRSARSARDEYSTFESSRVTPKKSSSAQ